MRNYQMWAPVALRIGLGLLFIYTGITKLMNPSMVNGMLGGIGFPAPTFWTWVLILAEVLCGLAVLVGFKVEYATVPLAVILVVAMVAVYHSQVPQLMMHLAMLSGVVALWLSGPGAVAVSKQ